MQRVEGPDTYQEPQSRMDRASSLAHSSELELDTHLWEGRPAMTPHAAQGDQRTSVAYRESAASAWLQVHRGQHHALQAAVQHREWPLKVWHSRAVTRKSCV